MPRLADWFALVRFTHTLFALPFALIALLAATGGRPSPRLLVLVVLCAVAARTAAMAYNRYVDRRVDAANPRTAGREIPRGVISARQALLLAAGSGLAFLGCAWLLAPLCFWLGIPVLAVLLGYSHGKRFTALVHAWLGLALGLAPLAAHVAATGVLDRSLLAPGLLGAGVMAWVFGFDLLYACQDVDFDRAAGLHSLPARLGVATALRLAAAAHIVAVPLFWSFGWLAGFSLAYDLGVGVTAVLLVKEHRLVRPHDLARVNTAFFQMNALVSAVLLAATLLDLYLW